MPTADIAPNLSGIVPADRNMTDEVGATLPAGARVHDHIIEQWLRAVPDGHVYRVVHAQTGAVASLHEYLPAAWAFRDAEGVLAQPGRGREFQVGLRRFLLRGRQLGELHHPALPRVIESWPSHGTACILTTPVASRSLSDVVLAAGGRIPLEQAWPWLCACCDMAEWLHQQGKIHGAWDPETIGVRDNQDLVFPMPEVEGPAHPASAWMPLEQSALAPKGVQRGPWTDVFGIAALAAFMLTGQSPANARRRPTGLAVNLSPGPYRAPATQETLPRAMMAAIRVSLLPNARQRPQDIAQLKSMMGLFATAPVLSDELKPVLRLPVAAPTMVMPRLPANDLPLRAAAGTSRARLALLKRVDRPEQNPEAASTHPEAEVQEPASPVAEPPAVRIFAVATEARTPVPPVAPPAEAPLRPSEQDEPLPTRASAAGVDPSVAGSVAAPTPTPVVADAQQADGSANLPPVRRRRLSAPVLAVALGAAVVAVVGLWTSLSAPSVQPAPQLAGDPRAQDIERLLKSAPSAAGPAVATTAQPAQPAPSVIGSNTAGVSAAPIAGAVSPTAAAVLPPPVAGPVATVSPPPASRSLGDTVPKPAPALKAAAAEAKPLAVGGQNRPKASAERPREPRQAMAAADTRNDATARRGAVRPEVPPTRLARAPDIKPESARPGKSTSPARPADSVSGQKLAQAAPRAGAPADRRTLSCTQVLLEQSLGARVSPADVRNCR